jgi:glycosyltransferase involved in cell wall biosynthesis
MTIPVSFIVIARNQARTVCDSVQSVVDAVGTAGLPESEIVYVDSDSTDGSASLVGSRFGSAVRVVRLTGARNAGIARNVGASFATGRALFFIDGDMVVDPRFLLSALDSRHHLCEPVVTGQLPEKIYDAHWRFLGDAPDRYRIRRRERRAELGGVFLIDRQLFERIGGFSAELNCNEDLDLGLRLARAGSPTLALAQPIAVHHTVQYLDWTRIIPMVRDGSLFYPGALCRRHIANRHYLPVLASQQRSTLVLAGSLALAALSHPAWLAGYVAYVAAKNLRRPNVSFLQELAGTTARSACFVLGLGCFFPRAVPEQSITYRVLDGSG